MGDEDGMVRLEGGTCMIGSADSWTYPGDGETPWEVDLHAFQIDARAVSNQRFAEFVETTGHKTDAERYGWSFVFAGLLPDDFPDTRAVARTPWWRQVYGADWSHPEGPQSGIGERPENPAVHVSWNDAAAFCEWSGSVWEPPGWRQRRRTSMRRQGRSRWR